MNKVTLHLESDDFNNPSKNIKLAKIFLNMHYPQLELIANRGVDNYQPDQTLNIFLDEKIQEFRFEVHNWWHEAPNNMLHLGLAPVDKADDGNAWVELEIMYPDVGRELE